MSNTQLELAKAKLPEEIFNHLKWYLDREIEDMESYVESESNLSYADELHRRLLIGISNWIAKLLSQAVQAEREKLMPSKIKIESADGRTAVITINTEVINSLDQYINVRKEAEKRLIDFVTPQSSEEK